ncbi:unnamed protein product [Prorocentrum cordatum]|uniref:Peptidase M50 domain-containing protein n=1 Tax=Prorocentrum cordatum TaxID=2364126 RepID=A0ABN9UBM6_9DINO|nr:unnamed protein product [Polarella glacialis]
MMRRLGVACGPMVFVPFLGAAVEMKGAAQPSHEGLIAIAGPVLGAAAALVPLAAGAALGSDLLLRLASWGLLLNLLNLLPIRHLDGGRILAVLGAEARLALLGLLALGLLVQPGHMSALFFALGAFATRPWQPAMSSAGALAAPQGVALAAAYGALVGSLLVACQGAWRYRQALAAPDGPAPAA